MGILARLRERIAAAVAVVLASMGMLICGLILAFVISPQQAMEWRRIQSLPEMTAADVAAAAPGTDIAITGTLTDNPADQVGYVAYEVDRWDVEANSDSEGETTYSGSWTEIEEYYPALTLRLPDGMLRTTAASDLDLDGNLAERIEDGQGPHSDDYEGQPLHDGALRTEGLRNGDLVTVVGQKGSSGDLVPRLLYGGDRVQLVDEIRSEARGLFAGGLITMACAPLLLILGLAGVAFGRIKGK